MARLPVWSTASSTNLPRRRAADGHALSEYQLISGDHIAHGNEFMVITLNPQTGKLEYQHLHYRGLVILVRDE